MARINENYLKLKAGYLFPEIARRVNAFADANPQAKVIRLGIGDVVKGIPRVIVEAMKEAAEELAYDESFQGYPPEQGLEFLRQAVAENEFGARGIDIEADEVFISDGSKCDSGNIQEIFGIDNIVALTDPVYPVYCDSNVMAGRTGQADEAGRYAGLEYLPCTADNGFMPPLPEGHVDLIYLCSPNNPTGAVMTRETLAQWVSYARREKAIILFDAAYEGYITDDTIPHSIFEVEGAREVAIEFRSFSKNCGFTGTRCAFTVVPKELKAYTSAGEAADVHGAWLRRQSTKFNGVSYPVQRGAAASYTPEGRQAVRQLIDFYLGNARYMRQQLEAAGIVVYGGQHAPYLWLQMPAGQDSWGFFDTLLQQAHVVGTPGAGFGAAGEGYFRLSAFNQREAVEEAMDRILGM
ncbi:MAG: LL-diaminopimelate aminotransferase [Candidatus Latescibacteria bacterium]|nr:LL-diaminopimelate aminotransferase [Candidatus Latescibacterota bacterium]